MQLLDRLQVAALLPVSKTTLYKLIRKKKFPKPVKVGTRSLWRRDLVDAAIRRLARVGA